MASRLALPTRSSDEPSRHPDFTSMDLPTALHSVVV